MSSGGRMSFVFLIIFAGLTAFFHPILAVIEGCVVALLFAYYLIKSRHRAIEFRKYVEALTFQVDDASKHSLVNIPMPTAIIRMDNGEIVWCNQPFAVMTDTHESLFSSHMSEALPGLDTHWLMEGKTTCPYDLEVKDKKYNVYGNIVRTGDRTRSLLSILYFVDVTDYNNLRTTYENRKPIVAMMMVDSYEELFKGLTESEKSLLSAEIDRVIGDWVEPTGGLVRKFEQHKYLFIFENKNLIDFTAAKFPVLEAMKAVRNLSGASATLSIGIGKGADNFFELYKFASLGLEMALSRGGDQVVVKSRNSFDFYGGRAREVEKRTKVKSRVTANALKQLISDSSKVFITGHRFSDLDSVGSGAGICAAVRACGKTPYLLVDKEKTSAAELINKLQEAPEYAECFINEEEAILMADSASLLVVTDTTRPEFTECPSLVQSLPRIAVIDHHRKAASYIENPTISMHEPYASSASELVAELLQYIVTPQQILKVEAEAMLAGIFLDTKSFTVKTGVRTFEAAAYLKQLGADTVEVRRLFSENLSSYIIKSSIISSAENVFPGVIMSVTSEHVERAVAAQTADELVNTKGTLASFVVYGEGQGSSVSARSYGQMNVQVICEKIGGGGSMTMAGAQFPDEKPAEVAEMLKNAIASYIEDNQITNRNE